MQALIRIFGHGFTYMRMHSQLLLVGVLVFVFPILFLVGNQTFFDTAYDNIQTSEKRRVGIVHDVLSVETIIHDAELFGQTATAILQDNPDITKIRLVEQVGNDLVFRFDSMEPTANDLLVEQPELYRSALARPGESLIFEFTVNNVRTWQVFRTVLIDTSQYFIFTEHSFATVDQVLWSRQQQSYVVLTFIFIFLIALAYWLSRQIHWAKAHAQLQQQLSERDLFTQMITHEFRSPLTAMRGYASLLNESNALSAEEQTYVRYISDSTKRLVLLVNDFLEVARIQAGQLQVIPTTINIQQILKKVQAEVTPLASVKSLVIQIDCPSDLVITTDSSRLQQIIINIVTNAIKYTSTGSVTMIARFESGTVSIRVADTGSGINAEDQQKLFAPFTRVGSADESTVVGTGLGMWITKQLITVLGGRIGIESIAGIGTHIVMHFPTEIVSK